MSAAQARALEEALELYRGPFLEGFSLADSAPFEEWARLEREQLEQMALGALGQLAGYWEEAGRSGARPGGCATPGGAGAVGGRGAPPGDAPAGPDGRRGEALAQYEACCRALAEELDVEPVRRDGGALRADPRRGAGKQRRGSRSASRPPAPQPARAPDAPVGREEELAEIGERLADPDCRLLTLVGPGGSGKTRLAVEAAAQATDAFPHGVYFVPLAPLGRRRPSCPPSPRPSASRFPKSRRRREDRPQAAAAGLSARQGDAPGPGQL